MTVSRGAPAKRIMAASPWIRAFEIQDLASCRGFPNNDSAEPPVAGSDLPRRFNIHKAEVRLMYEGRGLQRLAALLPGEFHLGESAEFLADNRK